jgi:hypothetical protein
MAVKLHEPGYEHAQRDYSDVQRAATHLHGMLEGSKQPSSR